VIKSEADLTVALDNLTEIRFVNFWAKYDPTFTRSSYTELGKSGWDNPASTPQRESAREPINRKKNEELRRLGNEPIVQQTVDWVFDKVQTKNPGVKRKAVKNAVLNHMKNHVLSLIYQDS